MKAIKYFIMGVMLAGFSTTANAQQEELNAALSAIKSKAPGAADLAKTAYKKNKKDPEALMKIARAYFEQKDTARQRGCQAQVPVCTCLSVARRCRGCLRYRWW